MALGQPNDASSGSLNGFTTLLAVTSNVALRLSTLKVTLKRSGPPEGTRLSLSNMRNSAQGPSVTIPEVPPAIAGCNCTRTCVLPFGPGHCTAVGICGPCAYFTSWPSRSSVNCVIDSSISCGLKSSRKPAALPPERKKVSRMTAARWNCARVPLSLPSDVSPNWRKLQGHVLVSTSAARFFWKNSSNRPPGENRREKSSCVTSVVLLRENG